MKKYRCQCRDAKCEFNTDDIFGPVYCPKSKNKGSYWKEVKETEVKEEEIAEELPSWCKVGEVVYYNDSYYTIVEMNGQYEVKITDGVEDEWVKTSNVQEARLRPFNESEMRELVGKMVECKSKVHIICSFIQETDAFYVRGGVSWYSPEALLRDYTLEGKPCGVYEHKKNGEWVE